eukprot:TRINITY_DN67012_c9_g5_i1.p1 TRINITY_DN67012_c9_g5~~TRINITY_DN67012_c9_g5_i1.p1  ORF type:complete len:138 (+),score=11.36 TRINITY_DN67012_c9_g5_i1:193-606(+)
MTSQQIASTPLTLHCGKWLDGISLGYYNGSQFVNQTIYRLTPHGNVPTAQSSHHRNQAHLLCRGASDYDPCGFVVSFTETNVCGSGASPPALHHEYVLNSVFRGFFGHLSADKARLDDIGRVVQKILVLSLIQHWLL